MEVVIILAIIAGLALLDWAALTFGVDSRVKSKGLPNL